jgi:hypothetical protein
MPEFAQEDHWNTNVILEERHKDGIYLQTDAEKSIG